MCTQHTYEERVCGFCILWFQLQRTHKRRKATVSSHLVVVQVNSDEYIGNAPQNYRIITHRGLVCSQWLIFMKMCAHSAIECNDPIFSLRTEFLHSLTRSFLLSCPGEFVYFTNFFFLPANFNFLLHIFHNLQVSSERTRAHIRCCCSVGSIS